MVMSPSLRPIASEQGAPKFASARISAGHNAFPSRKRQNPGEHTIRRNYKHIAALSASPQIRGGHSNPLLLNGLWLQKK